MQPGQQASGQACGQDDAWEFRGAAVPVQYSYLNGTVRVGGRQGGAGQHGIDYRLPVPTYEQLRVVSNLAIGLMIIGQF